MAETLEVTPAELDAFADRLGEVESYLHLDEKRARVAELDDDALRGILARARELLLKNVAQSVGQSVAHNLIGRPRTTRSSLRSERLWVYGRAGAPCFVCGTPIERFHQGKDPPRSTYTCPRCQPPPA